MPTCTYTAGSVNRESTAGWTDDQIMNAAMNSREAVLQTMAGPVWDALYKRVRTSSASGRTSLRLDKH
jgi:hypothetical protein